MSFRPFLVLLTGLCGFSGMAGPTHHDRSAKLVLQPIFQSHAVPGNAVGGGGEAGWLVRFDVLRHVPVMARILSARLRLSAAAEKDVQLFLHSVIDYEHSNRLVTVSADIVADEDGTFNVADDLQYRYESKGHELGWIFVSRKIDGRKFRLLGGEGEGDAQAELEVHFNLTTPEEQNGAVTRFLRESDLVTVEFAARAGGRYTVEAADSLPGVWRPVGTAGPDLVDGSLLVRDLAPPVGRRFYRVRLLGGEEQGDIAQFIDWLLSGDRELTGIPFGEVIQAVSGTRIIEYKRNISADQQLLDKFTVAMKRVLQHMNDPGHPAHTAGRINEVSTHFEEAIMEELNRVDGFKCFYPKTAEGKAQRSGYPDLRLTETASGRVVYVDPKLFATKNRASTLRTFYFTPKRETNKVLDDALHWLVGFEHGGRVEDAWKFLGWEVVDLSRLSVSLKAEFHGSNRDLYREENIIATSRD